MRVEVAVHDAADRLVHTRFCDGSGLSPCIATLPDRRVPAGGRAILYNPFPAFPAGLPLAALTYTLVFTDSAGIPVDTSRITVRPRSSSGVAPLRLPLSGRVLVYDGHDLLSHHRRWNLAHPVIRAVGFTGSSGRYAYDLSHVDSAGRMFRGTGDRNADWVSWNAPVRAPRAGRVVALANDQRDGEVGRSSLPDSVIFARPIALYGNYVVLDHGDGTFSMLAHLREGSVEARVGDRVEAGAPLARIGFSGSVKTIHLHYQLQSGPAYADEGVPSYFTGVRRVGASHATRIDTGDIVEAR